MTTKSPDQSPRRRSRHRPGLSGYATFRTGPGGARIVWPDGSVDAYPSYMTIRLEKRPKRIVGRVWRVKEHGQLGYEAPRVEL